MYFSICYSKKTGVEVPKGGKVPSCSSRHRNEEKVPSSTIWQRINKIDLVSTVFTGAIDHGQPIHTRPVPCAFGWKEWSEKKIGPEKGGGESTAETLSYRPRRVGNRGDRVNRIHFCENCGWTFALSSVSVRARTWWESSFVTHLDGDSYRTRMLQNDL